MTLERHLRRFLALEVFAHALYDSQIPRVPKQIRPVIKEFARIEAIHVERFEELLRIITDKPAPTYTYLARIAQAVSAILSVLGWKNLIRFECFVERCAIRDYTNALKWIKHTHTRKIIKDILAEEEVHHPYIQTLLRFRKEEQHHIDAMLKILESSS